MSHTVAVLTDTNGRSSNFLMGSQFNIYHTNNDEFSLANTLKYHLSGKSSLGSVRRELPELEKVLSAKLGCDSNFLVSSDKQQVKIVEGATIVYTDNTPETADGCYCFELKSLLLNKPSITSKQALIPFFTEVPFLSLDIVCEHVPPWFDREFHRVNFYYTAKKADDALRINVRHVTCPEGGTVSCHN